MKTAFPLLASIVEVRWFLMTVIFAAGCWLGPGCLGRPRLVTQSFGFALPQNSPAPAASSTAVLGLRNLTVAPAFEGRSFVYRTGEHSYERDPYAEFLVPPARLLVGPLRAHLRGLGVFAEVTEADSALRPDMRAEVHVMELYGDFRSASAPVSTLTIRFLFFDRAGKLILQKELSRRMPVKARTAANVMAGWDQGLSEIVKELGGALKTTL
jgi:cholesterol transport system auxiliary component